MATSPDLCLTCHKELKARLEKEKAHQPAGRDCEKCHRPHFSPQESLMSEAIQPLCTGCHNPQKPTFGKAHLNIEASAMDCRHCHDPHASKDPKLFQDTIHMPFGARSCTDCHLPQ